MLFTVRAPGCLPIRLESTPDEPAVVQIESGDTPTAGLILHADGRTTFGRWSDGEQWETAGRTPRPAEDTPQAPPTATADTQSDPGSAPLSTGQLAAIRTDLRCHVPSFPAVRVSELLAQVDWLQIHFDTAISAFNAQSLRVTEQRAGLDTMIRSSNAAASEAERLRDRVADLEQQLAQAEKGLADRRGPSFFEAGRVYHRDGPSRLFAVEHLTTHPDSGHRRAIGWMQSSATGGGWRLSWRDEDENDFAAWSEVTEVRKPTHQAEQPTPHPIAYDRNGLEIWPGDHFTAITTPGPSPIPLLIDRIDWHDDHAHVVTRAGYRFPAQRVTRLNP